MKIVNKLTLRHIKENKGRSVITVLGICVSVAMITAVFVAIASFLNLFGNIELLSSGNNVASFELTSKQQYDKLASDDRISEIGIKSTDEVSYLLTERTSDYRGVGDIISGDKTYLKQVFTGDYDGEIPQNQNEIAVEQSLIDDNNLGWKIGDTVSLPIGYRYYTENSQQFTVFGSYRKAEQFKHTNTLQCKVTAILHDNPATVSTASIIRGYEPNFDALTDNSPVFATINLKKCDHNALSVINGIISDCNIQTYEIKSSYLETVFAYEKGDGSILDTIIPLAVVIIAIIIVASVVLIYNAFAMSMSERVRYLGMLASVGATKKQKRRSVYFEGLIFGAIGIPLGFAGGVAGIGVTLKAIGKEIISTGMINGVSSTNMEMPVVVPAYAVLCILIVSVFTIFISMFIPSLKASKITPIDAIRQNTEIKVKAKKLKSSKLIRKIFGYEGELANKNLKRNGRKSRVITASIALSVILFLSCNYFCNAFTASIDFEADIPYQLSIYLAEADFGSDSDTINRQLNDMTAPIGTIDGVDNYFSATNLYDRYGESDLKFIDQKYYTDNYSDFTKEGQLYINAVDDEDFNALCSKNGIDSKQFYYGNNSILVMNNIDHKNGGDKAFEESLIGSTVDVAVGSQTVAGFVDYDSSSYVTNLNPKGSVSMFLPMSMFIKLSDELSHTPLIQIGIVTDNHSYVSKELTEMIASDDLDVHEGLGVMDIADSIQVMHSLNFVMQVLVYGFIALISLITVFNIINTISTSIALRKKEFAMLKSVGTTQKGFNKMIALESALYGIKAIAFSIPISILISIGMYMSLRMPSYFTFSINAELYLAVIAVVFVIIGATMLYSVNKLKNDSIVETLKMDIS